MGGPAGPPTFHLLFLGHEIGTETDHPFDWDATPGPLPRAGPGLRCSFTFVDRGTPIELHAVLAFGPDQTPLKLTVKGRNYRLFTSDSEVEIRDGRAHVRDLTAERDVDLGGKPFFPVDNYAPIGVQEALIKYWLGHDRPSEINSAPSGPVVRIVSRGTTRLDGARDRAGRVASRRLERLSIDGVVWGTETAWIDRGSGDLVALTTWAGQLPFEAIRDGDGPWIQTFIEQAVADRIADLEHVTKTAGPLQEGTYALTNALVVDSTGRPAYRGAIRIANGRIVAAGPDVRPARDEAVRDLGGAVVIPGLWDMHAHAAQIDWAPVYLASGVTTIRDMGGEEAFLVAIRDAIASGRALGPRYLLAGLVDGSGPAAFGRVWADTPDEGRAVVRRYHAAGFEQMKVYGGVSPGVVRAIADEAHRLGMTVTGHVPRGMTWQTVVEAGYDHIAHMQLRG